MLRSRFSTVRSKSRAGARIMGRNVRYIIAEGNYLLPATEEVLLECPTSAPMRQKTGRQASAAEKTIKDIRRATRKHHSAEEKIRIVLEGLRGEDSIAAICRREGIAESLYYSWSK